MPTEIFIVGAGPAGLVLALTLLHNGVPVRIIDKLTTPRVGQKGSGVQPRTLELFKFLDVLPDVLWEGRYYPPTRLYKFPGGIEPAKTWYQAERSAPKPGTPYLNPILIGQDHLETILRTHVERCGGRVEMGTELIDFNQDGEVVKARITKNVDGKDVEETVNAKFLVGTDGAKGIVRKQLGLQFLGETRDWQRIITGDVHVEGLDNDHWHRWANDRDEQVVLRPTERFNNVFTLMCGGPNVDYSKLVSDPKALVEFIESVIERKDLKFGDFVWLSEFRPNIRMVDAFGLGRVFVAGDAAHVHSPTGGQGMNSSVQDAFNLGWKLALVCKSLSPLSLLSTYSEERLPVIAEMLHLSTHLLNKTTGNNADLSAGLKRGGKLLQLGVNYQWSSIIVDERYSTNSELTAGAQVQNAYGAEEAGEEILRAGDRAPDAPGLVSRSPDSFVTSLFQVFKPTFHTVLVFTCNPDEAAVIAQSLQALPAGSVFTVAIAPGTRGYGPHVVFEGVDIAFIDVDGFAYKHYGVAEDKVTVVVVRPDSFVGAIIVSGVDGLKRYFGKILV
ncbi:hypothetical protein NEOLEDRAFT_1178648 [Neolentinus lepideus HHB14362 ss-1]|uniref:Uncharacterized protein n=1 Tax=Neolentinus lepideus HHB14362 ss-1 TaxID=1314782 RepID=A0A165SJ51_9AGAM|nr:hypothetical protein NEOLEDRAFT_1178648 [Neolentinus lepideus HHB14362 ss-1]